MEKFLGLRCRMGKFSSAKDTLGFRRDPFPSYFSFIFRASTLFLKSSDLSRPMALPCSTIDR
jgi:hypothetical protein